MPRPALPEPGPDEFYHADLEGLSVDARRRHPPRHGAQRSTNFGAGDLIEIAGDDGRVLTLPFDRRTVPVVDLAHGRLVVEPPAELAAWSRGHERAPRALGGDRAHHLSRDIPGPVGGGSVAGQGWAQAVWALETVDIRAFASDKHRGPWTTRRSAVVPGMVMWLDVVDACDRGGGRRPRAGQVCR